MIRFLVTWGIACSLGTAAATHSPIPEPVLEMLSQNCLQCHDADSEKGDVNLDHFTIDWSNPDQAELWERVLTMVDQGVMPPRDKDQPTQAQRETMVGFIDEQLREHTPIGGTLPRRLTKGEYEATVRSLFSLSKFKMPLGFPGDTEHHGFDNVGEGLVVSPSHLDAYAKLATAIADELFPPEKPTPVKQTWTAGPEDMVLSFSAASVHGDALRLVSRSVDIMRSCSWPSRIEISDSGTYQITVDASKFLSEDGHPFDDAMILEVWARPVTATDRSRISAFRPLHEISVTAESPETTTFTADLYEGETVIFRWKNAEMTHEHAELAQLMKGWFEKDPRFLAAWQKAVFPTGQIGKQVVTALRGRNGWDVISKHQANPNLDLSNATMESPLTRKLLALADSNAGTFNLADALCHFYHNHGPALEIHHLTIEGPLKLVESPADQSRLSRQTKITGLTPGQEPEEAELRAMVERLLQKAFRRPVDPSTVETFATIFDRHREAGHSLDESLHLLVRNILISPRFLYRSLDDEMDEYDLASRLSYFLTQGPPDATLLDLASRKRLSPDWVLRREAERLFPKTHTAPMIQSFVGQWLDTKKLNEIMPDPKFNFDEESTAIARRETERFFVEMLAQNLPMTDFIDPNFTFSTVSFVQRNYGFTPEFARAKGKDLTTDERKRFQKIEIERGGRYGGLLGQSAILMATANGVDTEPVHRGVWVLENILGTPPPPPPKDIPALTPDTRGTTTPRELLAAHTEHASCFGCHQRIDPIGFVLENYDPVGRWRKEWPNSGATIDSAAVLPDGTEITNAIDFKAWLVENIDLFSVCVSEKLLTYATGRVPNYAERHAIKEIVKKNRENGQGFRDLVLDLIDSPIFRAP